VVVAGGWLGNFWSLTVFILAPFTFVCLLCLLSVWHNNRSLSRIFQTLQRKVRQPVCHVTHLPFGKPWPCGVRFNLLTCDVCLRPTLSSCCGLSTCQYVLSTYFCGKNTDRAVRVKNLLCEPALVLLYVVAMFRLLTSCFFTLVFTFLLLSFCPFVLFYFSPFFLFFFSPQVPRIQWMIAPKFVHVVLQNQEPGHPVLKARLPAHLKKDGPFLIPITESIWEPIKVCRHCHNFYNNYGLFDVDNKISRGTVIRPAESARNYRQTKYIDDKNKNSTFGCGGCEVVFGCWLVALI
jgi:hypothetical protein